MEDSVSAEDRHKVYDLCRTQLSGKWTEISENEVIIKRVKVGFVNKLFYCFLPENVDQIYGKVVVRFHNMDIISLYGSETHVLVKSLLVSQQNISPKLLSIFNEGFISEYIESRYLTASDDHNPRTAGLLGQKLAKFHSLQPPIPKDSTEGTVNFDQWFDEKQRQSLREGRVREEIVTNQLNTFLTRDLLAEMSWLRHQVLAIKSPVLFSHNDFNRTNILIRDLNPDNNELDIYFVDFDFSSYNYRGCDFGNYFSTWASDSAEFGVDSRFPTNCQMCPFIDGYIREMTAINGNSFTQLEINSRQRLIKEAKVFALLKFINDIMSCIERTVNGSDDSTELMKKAEIRFKCYSHLKDRIIQEYSDITLKI